MIDDFGGKAVTMIKRDGAHACSMLHELADWTINLTIPSIGILWTGFLVGDR
jgi:hypothetical protein